jgi:GNAT superfamily N-acetyltransferase
MSLGKVEIFPVTPNRWTDMQALFGKRGACGGCWCMYWRLRRSEYEPLRGEGNRLAMQSLIESGEVPGLLAYLTTSSDSPANPIGWCSAGPREAFPVLERSRILKRVDDQPVWSIVCFFIARPYRRQGITVQLLASVVDYAHSQGVKIVEGYPVEPKTSQVPPVFVYTGLFSAFQKTGFIEVARRSATRPIMRHYANR